MNYAQTLEYLFSQLPMFQRVGEIAMKKGLGNIIALCQHLQNPQTAYPTVHIAGTNGKGSTTHLIAAILQASGLRVGVYVSPHYRDFRERIKINGAYISEQEVVDFVAQHRSFFEGVEPSFFEITVAMAFDHFRRHKVDVAVIETGLGGRLDSTNIISPLLSVITNIDYDHQNLLGNTLPEIATEKAGIIKPNTPVIIGEEAAETRPVFEAKAQAENAAISFASRAWRALPVERELRRTWYDVYCNNTLLYERLELGLSGSYQQQNLVTVLAAVTELQRLYFPQITEEHLRQGCAQVKTLTNFIGRWEIMGEKPLVIADSAHNPHGFRYVMEQLNSIPHRQLHFVLGVVKDKDLATLFELLPRNAIYYFCAPDIPRALPTDVLAEKAQENGFAGKAYPSVKQAFLAACNAADADDLVYIGGSIFVLGEVI